MSVSYDTNAEGISGKLQKKKIGKSFSDFEKIWINLVWN